MAEKRRPSKFIGFRLPLAEVAALDEIAKSDNRTRNGLIRHVLSIYIQQQPAAVAMAVMANEGKNA